MYAIRSYYALVSIFLLWLYRRAVVRAMSARSGVAVAPLEAPQISNVVRRGTFPVLEIIDSSSSFDLLVSGGRAYRQALHSLNSCAGVYALSYNFV